MSFENCRLTQTSLLYFLVLGRSPGPSLAVAVFCVVGVLILALLWYNATVLLCALFIYTIIEIAANNVDVAPIVHIMYLMPSGDFIYQSLCQLINLCSKSKYLCIKSKSNASILWTCAVLFINVFVIYDAVFLNFRFHSMAFVVLNTIVSLQLSVMGIRKVSGKGSGGGNKRRLATDQPTQSSSSTNNNTNKKARPNDNVDRTTCDTTETTDTDTTTTTTTTEPNQECWCCCKEQHSVWNPLVWCRMPNSGT